MVNKQNKRQQVDLTKQIIWTIGGFPYGKVFVDMLSQKFRKVYYSMDNLILKKEASPSSASIEAEDIMNSNGRIDLFLFMDQVMPESSLLTASVGNVLHDTERLLEYFLIYSKEAIKRMTSARISGKIIALCNIAGVCGNKRLLSNSINSGAIIGFCRSLAKELGRHSISVNVICYGYIQDIPYAVSLEEEQERLMKSMGLGGTGGMESLVDSICYLSSPNAHITGQVLRVDGGLII